MNKKTIGIIIGAILLVAGFFYFTKPAEKGSAEPTNHTFGTSSSGVTLTEYADFQCPACAAYHPILKQLKVDYDGYVVFQFRHFPLEALHKNARAAGRAAEAASNQGKFWEMHDYLFENQQQWQDTSDPLSLFESYAEQVGVTDLAKFTTDYRSSTVNDLINADLDAGRALGVESTPTFLIDGKVLDENPSGSIESFAVLLDEAIKAKGGTPPAFRTEQPATSETPVTPAPQQ